MPTDVVTLCMAVVILPPWASRSDTCGKPKGHADFTHRGQYRGVEWYVADGVQWCGAELDGACCGLEVPCPEHPPAGFDDWHDERTGLISGGYPPVLAANDRDAGLIDETLVWIAIPRRGIERHALAPHAEADGHPFTVCGRSTRTGELRLAGEPWVVEHTKPCPRCWPPSIQDGA